MSEQTTIINPELIPDPGFLGGIWQDAQTAADAVSDSVGTVNPLDPFGIVSEAITLGGDVLGATVDAAKGVVGSGQGTVHDATVGFAKQFGTILGVGLLLAVLYLVYRSGKESHL